jgi:hypothetical protein
MRFDILVLALLGVGSLAPVSAADPAPATQPERTTAPAAGVSDSAHTASAPTEAPAPPPASSTAASPSAPPKGASDLSADEQRLIKLGYKAQMRNGEKIYCRREAAAGSRISNTQHCGTVAQLATAAQEGQDSGEKIRLKGY